MIFRFDLPFPHPIPLPVGEGKQREDYYLKKICKFINLQGKLGFVRAALCDPLFGEVVLAAANPPTLILPHRGGRRGRGWAILNKEGL